MTPIVSTKPLVAFDLDDTLYPERMFVRCAFSFIIRELNRWYGTPVETLKQAVRPGGSRAMDNLHSLIPDVSIARLLEMYRNHPPQLRLEREVREVLDQLHSDGYPMAVITEGRAVTQMNKIVALGLEQYLCIEPIIVPPDSPENKLSGRPFTKIEETVRSPLYLYVGDNPAKDFQAPNRMGWLTVMLRDRGTNIHSQPEDTPPDMAARLTVGSLTELPRILAAIQNS